jgi:hypothetical protein
MPLASVEVKVHLHEENGNKEEIRQLESTSRDQFWKCLSDHSATPSNKEEKTPRELELLLEQGFGLKLHSLLAKHFLASYPQENIRDSRDGKSFTSLDGSRGEYEYTRLLPKILFKARVRRYSSLVFGVDISGIESLARLFDGSYDTFELFLDQYIPEAFRATYRDWEGYAEYSIIPDAAIRDAFSSLHSRDNRINAKPLEAMQRAKWMWILANTSLVLPSIAALAGAFLMVSAVDRQQDRLNQTIARNSELDQSRERDITRAYNDLIKGYSDLLGRLSNK